MLLEEGCYSKKEMRIVRKEMCRAFDKRATRIQPTTKKEMCVVGSILADLS